MVVKPLNYQKDISNIYADTFHPQMTGLQQLVDSTPVIMQQILHLKTSQTVGVTTQSISGLEGNSHFHWHASSNNITNWSDHVIIFVLAVCVSRFIPENIYKILTGPCKAVESGRDPSCQRGNNRNPSQECHTIIMLMGAQQHEPQCSRLEYGQECSILEHTDIRLVYHSLGSPICCFREHVRTNSYPALTHTPGWGNTQAFNLLPDYTTSDESWRYCIQAM